MDAGTNRRTGRGEKMTMMRCRMKVSVLAVPVVLGALFARSTSYAADPAVATAATHAKICLTCHATAPGTLRGHWESVAMKASSIQLKIDGGAEVVKFDAENLRVVNAPEKGDVEDMLRSIKKGHEVRIAYEERDGAKVATVVAAKPPVQLSPADAITLTELQRLVAQGPVKGKYFLFDARPAPRFKEGAIPTAVSLPYPEFDKVADRLPADKDSLVVFYCSGPTCNMSPGAQKKAKALGYTNAKVFIAGMPGWYGKSYGVLSAQHLVDAYKDVPHVLLDARKPAAAKAGFIRGAVAGSDKVVKALPKKELKAPIIVYDEDGKGNAAKLALKIVKAGYVNVNVLGDGLAGAKLAGLPVETGALAAKVTYVPKPKPGELAMDAFARFLTEIPADTVVLDVRNPEELEDGTIAGSVNVPADRIDGNLDRIPREKKIVTFCGTGTRAEMAYHTLKAKGFATVAFLNAKVEFDEGKVKLSK